MVSQVLLKGRQTTSTLSLSRNLQNSAGLLYIEGDQVGQAGPAFPGTELMLAVHKPLDCLIALAVGTLPGPRPVCSSVGPPSDPSCREAYTPYRVLPTSSQLGLSHLSRMAGKCLNVAW